MSYFEPTFDKMNTSTIQLWLHEAQWRLPSSEGAIREMLKEGIKTAATELLFRYKHNL